MKYLYDSKFDMDKAKEKKLNRTCLDVLNFLIITFRTSKAPEVSPNVRWVQLKTVEREMDICHSTASLTFKRLQEANLIRKKCNRYYRPSGPDKGFERINKLMVCLNFKEILKLIPQCKMTEDVREWLEEKAKVGSELLETGEKKNRKQFKIAEEADKIAKDLLHSPQATMFRKHYITFENKTYVGICKIIQDLYNGSFLNPRIYDFDENWKNRNSSKLQGWKKRVQAVQGNWDKVKKLIWRAVRNYELAHKEEYLPFNKNLLERDLQKWLYDSWKKKSQFLLYLNPPKTIQQYYSQKKADTIIENLPYSAVQVAKTMCKPDFDAATYWKNIERIYRWYRTARKFTNAIDYAASNFGEFISNFKAFMEYNKVEIIPVFFDIKLAVERNTPWRWYVEYLCKNYNINPDFKYCVTKKDFRALFEKGQHINEKGAVELPAWVKTYEDKLKWEEQFEEKAKKNVPKPKTDYNDSLDKLLGSDIDSLDDLLGSDESTDSSWIEPVSIFDSLPF